MLQMYLYVRNIVQYLLAKLNLLIMGIYKIARVFMKGTNKVQQVNCEQIRTC